MGGGGALHAILTTFTGNQFSHMTHRLDLLWDSRIMRVPDDGYDNMGLFCLAMSHVVCYNCLHSSSSYYIIVVSRDNEGAWNIGTVICW